jgi:hypothetical protein
MKIEIELSDAQHAAVVAVSKKVRLSTPDTVRLLAVLAMNQQTDREDFLAFASDALEAIEAGRWNTGTHRICGWLTPPAAALAPAKLLEAASNEPQIDAPLSVTLPPHLSAAIRFSACVNGQSPMDYIIDQMAEVEDDVAASWFGGEAGAKEWLREKAEFESPEVGHAVA